MIKGARIVLFFTFIFTASLLLTEYLQLFKSPKSVSYLVYEPNIGINQAQFNLVTQHFGFKEVKKSFKKIDYEYRMLPKLNDNTFIALAAKKCSKEVLGLGEFPSKLILIKRYKKYDYAVVKFFPPLTNIADCLLFEFNEQIRKNKLVFLDKEFKSLSALLNKQTINETRSMLVDNISLLSALKLLYSPDYRAYNYWVISPPDPKKSTLKLSIVFALLNTIIFLLLMRLFKLRRF